MATKKPAGSAIPPHGPDVYLGEKWSGPTTTPDPAGGMALPAETERGEKLTGAQRASGLGLSERRWQAPTP